MITQNINIGDNVSIHETSSVNNVKIGNNVRISKRCSIFGSAENILEIGTGAYIGMNTTLNGYAARLRIGASCSIAQSVNIMTDSGPNASVALQSIFPIVKGTVDIGDHCWLGANVTVMPNVVLGSFCVVAANSFVNRSFSGFCVIAGSPARLIRQFSEDEIKKLEAYNNV